MLPVFQGQLGLVNAIMHLTQKSYIVSLPLVDNQDYDLVADIEGTLKKVQVKSSRTYNEVGNLEVQIKRVRPNKTKNTIYPFDPKAIDYLFMRLKAEIGLYHHPLLLKRIVLQ